MSTAKETQAGLDREIVITRLIDAPRERVWRAWADPAELSKWWGPHGFTSEISRHDFRSGGMWKYTMIGPDRKRYPNLVRFEEIIAGERIVYSNGGDDESGKQAVHFRSFVVFVAKGEKTELTLRTVFDTPADRDRVVREFGVLEGGRQTLSRLAALVAGDFLISRMFDAPRARVWQCWTELDRLAAWFGPKGFETVSAQLDFRPRGRFHYRVRGNGVDMWGKWTFTEIDTPAKLVFINAFSDKDGGLGRHPLAPDWPAQMKTTVSFSDLGPRTLVTLQWSPFQANEDELKTFADGMAGMQQGWSGTFERLNAHLAAFR